MTAKKNEKWYFIPIPYHFDPHSKTSHQSAIRSTRVSADVSDRGLVKYSKRGCYLSVTWSTGPQVAV